MLEKIIYLLVINLIAFSLMGIDKFLAIKHMYRISEFFLIGVALIGGVFGSILGMYYFRHKTKHFKFKYGLPIIAILYVIMLVI